MFLKNVYSVIRENARLGTRLDPAPRFFAVIFDERFSFLPLVEGFRVSLLGMTGFMDATLSGSTVIPDALS
jgi:hypothetical protein